MDKERWDSDETVSTFVLLNHHLLHIDQFMILYQYEKKVSHDKCSPCG